MSWQPHVTVATIVEDNDRFLLVEEISGGKQVINQPAGHVEAGETLQQAAIRETLEETGWDVELQGLVGMSLYTGENGVTYFRTTFFARALQCDQQRPLDDGIITTHWLSYEQMLDRRQQMRSGLVIAAVEQYRQGHRYPLSFIYRDE